VSEVFGKLAGIAEWFIGFVREVDRGIAVGRGYAPVGKKTTGIRRASRVRLGAGCGRRRSGGWIRNHWAGRRGAGGWS
jgi:hypothetical protein